jgi:hypothetical protein
VGVYLIDHPPAVSQFKSRGATRPSGLVVVHTAESVMDAVGPDTGAENVADFIRRRTTYGSYHDLVDSDTIVQLVRYEDQAYQDGTGSNPRALSISFACRTTDWAKMSAERRRAFLWQGAQAFARQQAWLRSKGYPTTPIRRISKAESDRGVLGLIAHGDRDPGRRSDPGVTAPNLFPWDEFFTLCRAAVAGANPLEDDMPYRDWPQADKDALATDVANRLWTYSPAGDATWPIHRLIGSDIKTGATSAAVSQLLSDAGRDAGEIAAALRPIILDAVTQGMAADNNDTADQIAARIAAKLAAPTP